MNQIERVEPENVWDLTDSGISMLYGMPDAGKSTLTQYACDNIENQRIAIIDYHHEFTKVAHKPNVDRFKPKAVERNNDEQLMSFLVWALKKIKAIGYDIIIIDEFNQYIRNSKHETPYILNDLKNNLAHEEWNHAKLILLQRHPAQGDSEFRETAKNIISFRVTGNNAKKTFNDIQDGLGDLVKSLHSYYFVVVSPQNYFWVSEPVPEDYATSK